MKETSFSQESSQSESGVEFFGSVEGCMAQRDNCLAAATTNAMRVVCYESYDNCKASV